MAAAAVASPARPDVSAPEEEDASGRTVAAAAWRGHGGRRAKSTASPRAAAVVAFHTEVRMDTYTLGEPERFAPRESRRRNALTISSSSGARRPSAASKKTIVKAAMPP